VPPLPIVTSHVEIGVVYGGTIPSETVDPDCWAGLLPEAPSYEFELAGFWDALTIGVDGTEGDPTLAVRDPAGAWHCNDDHNGLLPLIRLERASDGPYAVWVGAYAPDVQDVALLHVVPNYQAASIPTGTLAVAGLSGCLVHVNGVFLGFTPDTFPGITTGPIDVIVECADGRERQILFELPFGEVTVTVTDHPSDPISLEPSVTDSADPPDPGNPPTPFDWE